jgi:hypothetical protein
MSHGQPKFEQELRVYRARRSEWVAHGHERDWVAILGERALGPFSTIDEAWRAGMAEFGAPGFMVRRIVVRDVPAIVSHICLHHRPPASASAPQP